MIWGALILIYKATKEMSFCNRSGVCHVIEIIPFVKSGKAPGLLRTCYIIVTITSFNYKLTNRFTYPKAVIIIFRM